jgi:Pretoxin HINT domain
LKVGDKVLSLKGEWTRVIDIEREIKPTLVYNFEVEDNHNYFVGEIGVLSHNCGIFRILENDRGTVNGAIDIAKGTVEVMFDMVKEGDKLILNNFHVGGDLAPGSLMPKAAKALEESIVQQIGKQQGVKEVILQPGMRTGGAKAKNGIFETPPPRIYTINQ